MDSTHQTAPTPAPDQVTGRRRKIGIIGTVARVVVGLGLLGSVVWGEWSEPIVSIMPAESISHSRATLALSRSGGPHFAHAPFLRTASSVR